MLSFPGYEGGMSDMDGSPLTLQAHFASLPDPRMDRTKRHSLLDILVIAICAVICGADSWVEIEG